jgi:hypothetical protein
LKLVQLQICKTYILATNLIGKPVIHAMLSHWKEKALVVAGSSLASLPIIKPEVESGLGPRACSEAAPAARWGNAQAVMLKF